MFASGTKKKYYLEAFYKSSAMHIKTTKAKGRNEVIKGNIKKGSY